DLSVRATGAVILGPERMPNLVLAGPVNLHQLVEPDVLDEHDKHQFLTDPLTVSRDGVSCLEESDGFHGSQRPRHFFFAESRVGLPLEGERTSSKAPQNRSP